jgi:EAL domain-containing protein (putative c-di-GMP-specific phosphodiesterase class I)
VLGFMDDLRRRGISFALDGFGAGHTALRHLKDFNFDIVKVDAQFSRAIHRDPDNQVLMAAFLSIARQFDMLCVAQGVERAEEAEWLCAPGVDCLQGYHFAAPTVTPDWAETEAGGDAAAAK